MTIYRLLELLTDNLRGFKICYDHFTGFIVLSNRRNTTIFEGSIEDLTEDIVETELLPTLMEVD